MRLIDLDEIEKDSRWHEGICYDLSREVVYDADIVDAEPVVHGHWIHFESDKGGHMQYCSSCEVGCPERTDYCPHCGAKMDERAK